MGLLINREMQIKTSVRYHLTPVKRAIIRKSTNNRASLVQWLRLCAPNAGAQIQSLVKELDPTCCS